MLTDTADRKPDNFKWWTKLHLLGFNIKVWFSEMILIKEFVKTWALFLLNAGRQLEQKRLTKSQTVFSRLLTQFYWEGINKGDILLAHMKIYFGEKRE